MKTYRISAAGIVIHQNKILLVRYPDKTGKGYLVGPGGGVEIKESMPQAVVREVREETGLDVLPGKILAVEDLLSSKHRLIKIWFLCTLTGGQLQPNTQAAQDEGIIEVGWHTKEQLANEVVYPSIIKDCDWKQFAHADWMVKYLGLTKADF